MVRTKFWCAMAVVAGCVLLAGGYARATEVDVPCGRKSIHVTCPDTPACDLATVAASCANAAAVCTAAGADCAESNTLCAGAAANCAACPTCQACPVLPREIVLRDVCKPVKQGVRCRRIVILPTS